MKKTVGLISLLILMMGLVSCNGKRSISTFPLGLKMLKILKCTTIREYLYQQKRK